MLMSNSSDWTFLRLLNNLYGDWQIVSTTSFSLITPDDAVRERFSLEVTGRGMQYEAIEFERIVHAGLRESPLLPLAETVQIAAAMDQIRAQIGVEQTWLVSYSGGSQLVTKFLIPAHSSTFAGRGGAVILGGGGRPAGTPNIDPALKAGFPMHWYTGDIDDGRNTSDRYNAIRDARAGHAWYADRGYAATIETPAGVDHGDLGGRFGTVLAEQLDARG